MYQIGIIQTQWWCFIGFSISGFANIQSNHLEQAARKQIHIIRKLQRKDEF